MSLTKKQLGFGFAVLAILLLAAGIRIARYRQLAYLPNDSYNYCAVAEMVARNGWQSLTQLSGAKKVSWEAVLNKPPLLSALMAWSVRRGGDAARTGLAINFVCGMLCIIFLGAVTWELFGDRRYVLGTLLLAALMPVPVRYSCVILRDMPYWCMCCGALWAALRATGRGQCWYWWSLFAVFAALAILTRKEGMELVAAFCIYWVVFDWRRTSLRMTLRTKSVTVVAVFVPLLLIILPIQIYLNRCGWNWQCIPWESIMFYFIR